MHRSLFDDDPFFRQSMNDMNRMMMMDMTRGPMPGRRRQAESNSMALSPFGFGGMFGGGLFGGSMFGGSPFGGMERMMGDMENSMRMMQHGSNGLPGASFQSSYTSISYGSGGDGQPRVYQSSSSTKVGANGVKETRKSEKDSMSGMQKMAVGHHIGERAHVIEKSKNLHNGDEEESQEFVNIDEDEAEKFNEEFMGRIRSARPTISHHRRSSPYFRHPHHPAAIEYHQPGGSGGPRTQQPGRGGSRTQQPGGSGGPRTQQPGSGGGPRTQPGSSGGPRTQQPGSGGGSRSQQKFRRREQY